MPDFVCGHRKQKEIKGSDEKKRKSKLGKINYKIRKIKWSTSGGCCLVRCNSK